MPQEIKESEHFPQKKQEELLKTIHTAPFALLRDIIEKGELPLEIPLQTQGSSRTLLHYIVMSKEGDSLKLLEWILMHHPSKIDINAQTINGYTPLSTAVEFRNIEAAKLLIAYGANPEIKTAYNKTALNLCINRFNSDQVSSIKKLIKDFQEGKRPLSKPDFLTEEEAGLISPRENKSLNISQNIVRKLKDKVGSTAVFWKHVQNMPVEESVSLLDKKAK